MAADRGAYICQSQSLNIFMENANFGKLTSMHFYAWKSGLKTGMYYLRTKAATDAIKFTVDKTKLAAPQSQEAAAPVAVKAMMPEAVTSGATAVAMTAEERAAAEIACSLDDPDGCVMCSG